MLTFTRSIFITVQLWVLILTLITNVNGIGLTQFELREKYGQAGTTFNDGKSCYRTCDGQTMTCYFEFHAQYYDTLNSLCGGCQNGTLSDCFTEGCIPADGVERVLMTINQQLPGSAINVCKGDRVIVDVANHMSGQGLTIHWHGMHQIRTPWMDGVPMVTQCPINAANTFRYEFYTTNAGTQVWHAHSGVHRTNGITGTLVIRDSNDPNANMYDYDLAEHSILLFDWDIQMAEDNLPGIRNAIPLSRTVLINGFGSHYDSTTGKNTFAPMEVFYVQRGKRHRFRIMNAGSNACQFGISIGGHNLTVIATDGYSIEPIVVDSLVCSSGERYDIVMHATSDPSIAETLLIVREIAECSFKKIQEFARIIFVDDIFHQPRKIEHHAPLEKRPSYESVSLAAPKRILNYSFNNCVTPGSYCIAALQQKKLSNSFGINLRNVKPMEVISLNFNVVPVHHRPFAYKNEMGEVMVSSINGIVNMASPVPGLTQNDSNVQYCNANNLPENHEIRHNNTIGYNCPHLIPLKLNKVYEFLLIAEFMSHPIHLHGYLFQVIDMGTLDQLKSGQTAFRNAAHPPVYKDTVAIPKHGFVRIRVRTSNPGYWLLHCHYTDHELTGMMLTLKVGDKEDMIPPPANFPTCGNYLVPVF